MMRRRQMNSADFNRCLFSTTISETGTVRCRMRIASQVRNTHWDTILEEVLSYSDEVIGRIAMSASGTVEEGNTLGGANLRSGLGQHDVDLKLSGRLLIPQIAAGAIVAAMADNIYADLMRTRRSQH